MEQFLSLDWGTSAIRLRLVNVPVLSIVGEVSSDAGIGKTYAGWQAAETGGADSRLFYFLAVIQRHLQQLEANLQITLTGIPLVVSGMASASIGLRELPYQAVPFPLDGTGLITEFIPGTANFQHDLYLISGVQTQNDVMRGEETQLIGFASRAAEVEPEALYIFPGTHSKHIWVKQKQVTGFKTYMTGEFFSLLAEYSILKNSVAEDQQLPEEVALASFGAGVKAAQGANLLQIAFQVRTNDLFKKFTPAANRYYLSGLLIGSELEELTGTSAAIYLCGGANLHKHYAAALQELKLPQTRYIYPPQLADEAVVWGQYQILQTLKQLK